MIVRFFPLLLAGSFLTGCASYAPSPLRHPGDVLAPPDFAIISRDVAKIDRPFLTPQAIDISQPLTPNALAAIAVIENPDLKAQRAKSGVADAQAFSARLIPDPTLQGNFDKLLSGPDMFNGFGGQLGFDLNALRTARVLRENADAAGRQVRLDMAWAEWQTAGQARLQGARILYLEQQLVLAQSSADSAERLFGAAQRAGGRGDISAAEVDTRRQAALDAANKLRTAQNDLRAARGELNKLLGLPPETVLVLAPPADPAVAPPAETLVAQAIDRRLDLQALRAGYDAAEADVHKAVLDQFPTLSLTIAGARDTADNYTLGPAVGLTLPLWNRNRGGIAVAEATREQLKSEYDARLFQTRADIAAAASSIVSQREQAAALRRQMPGAERIARASTEAAKRGDLSQAAADTAAQALRDRQITLLQLEQQIAEQTIALELLSGGPSEGWMQ